MRRRLEAEREDFGTGDADRQPAVGERGGGDKRFCSAGGMIGGTGGLGAGLGACLGAGLGFGLGGGWVGNGSTPAGLAGNGYNAVPSREQT